MVFFPHKKKRKPAGWQDFMDYVMECMKQKDYLAAMFYCYWGAESVKAAKVKKKDREQQEKIRETFLSRAQKLRALHQQNPVASTMDGFELEVMLRRLRDAKDEFWDIGRAKPSSREEVDRLAEKAKALAQEAAFLEEYFAPHGDILGTEAWLENLGKIIESLYSNIS
ncbi:MAG: hypothetical protein ACTSU5_19310 [Promethearchaeota archaeon]